MTSKHVKTDRPTDADLKGNPLIGGSKGVTRAQASPEDLEDLLGENTVPGDVGNDTNAQGGVAKTSREARGKPDR